MKQTRILLIALVLLVCFSMTAVFRSGFSAVDTYVNRWSASVNEGSFTFAAKIISGAFDTNALTILSLAVAVLFLVSHHGRYGLLLLSGVAGNALLVELCKALVASPRPLNEIIAMTDHSFPSVHVSSTVVFFGVLTYFGWKRWNERKTKVLLGMAYVCLTAVVGFDRIYLNVHWLSDVIGAVFLGAFWLTLCIYAFEYLVTSSSDFKGVSLRRQKQAYTNLYRFFHCENSL